MANGSIYSRTSFDSLRGSGSGCVVGYGFLFVSVLCFCEPKEFFGATLPEQPSGVSKGAFIKEPPSTSSGSGYIIGIIS